MIYEFVVYPMTVDDHSFWAAESKSLKGCVGQGDTAQEAIAELESNETEWLIMAKEFNLEIPSVAVHKEERYSGKISLRFSPFEHEKASRNAQRMGISLNQYISDAITNYNASVTDHLSSLEDASTFSKSTVQTKETFSFKQNIIPIFEEKAREM